MSEALLQELIDINKAMKEELSKQNIILNSQKRYSQDEFDEAYQRGLNDAWEAAKKITLNPSRGGMPTKELATIFGEFDLCGEIMERSTASEAVAKLKEYGQKQANKTPFKNIKRQIKDIMNVRGVNIADIYMAVEELLREEHNVNNT